MNRLIATTACVLCVIVTAEAGEPDRFPQLAQEVFRSELVYPQDAGELQTTLATSAGGDHGHTAVESGLRLEYGITDRWQVEAQWASVTGNVGGDGDLGIGDVEVGTKYAVLGIGGSPWHAAGSLEVTIPVADVDHDLGDGVLECAPSVLAAVDVTRPWRAHLFGAIGGALRERVRHAAPAEPARDGVTASLGVLVPIRRMRLSVELSGELDVDGTAALDVTPGTIWEFPAGLELALGVPIGLTGDTEDVGLVAMLTHELPLFGGGRSED